MASNKAVKQSTSSKKQAAIAIENIFQGGIADSSYIGQKNSVLSCVGFDIYSTPGLIQAAQRLTKESNAPTDDYYKILPCSDGNIYLFGKTLGHVYKNTNGTYTLLGTVAPSGGSVGVLDAIEYKGYIFYAMQSYMGQWNFAMAFSTRNDSWQQFAAGNQLYHPFIIQNNYMYCADSNNITQYDGTTFTNNALVLSLPQIISCLGKQVTDLLIGTIVNNNVPECHVYRWDTWSISYINDYPIKEAGVNAFLPTGEQTVTVQAGQSGNIYSLNGSDFQLYSAIPPLPLTTYKNQNNSIIVNYPATAFWGGLALFGVSNVANNPAYQGVYAYGGYSAMYPSVITLPFPISTKNTSGITIWSIACVGQTFYVSSYDSNTSTYQIDQLDFNNQYNGAFLETRLIKYSRIWLDTFAKIVVNYQSLNGQNINVYYDANWNGYIQYTGSDVWNDTDRNEFVCNMQVRAKTIKFKIQTTASGNNSPKIEDILIFPE